MSIFFIFLYMNCNNVNYLSGSAERQHCDISNFIKLSNSEIQSGNFFSSLCDKSRSSRSDSCPMLYMQKNSNYKSFLHFRLILSIYPHTCKKKVIICLNTLENKRQCSILAKIQYTLAIDFLI